MQNYVSAKTANTVGDDLKLASTKLNQEISNAVQNFHNSDYSSDMVAINKCIDALFAAIENLEKHAECLQNVSAEDQVSADSHFVSFCNKVYHSSPKEILLNSFGNELKAQETSGAVDIDDEETVLELLDQFGYWVTDYKIQ